MTVRKLKFNPKPSQEYLLMCLSEECNEIGKVASKIFRFGQNDFDPNKSPRIKNRIQLRQKLAICMGCWICWKLLA